MRFSQILAVGFVALATNASSYAAAPSNPTPSGYLECPAPNALEKNTTGNNWYAKEGWKSYESSFATHVDKFLGAQWQGVDIGHIACIYRSNETLTFPIVLHYNRLVYAPSGGNWGKNLGGYMNCKSPGLKNCLFRPQPKPKAQNIYQQAGGLKGQPEQELGF